MKKLIRENSLQANWGTSYEEVSHYKISMKYIDAIDHESEYREILIVIQEHNGEIEYKELNDLLSHKFEGVRLRLKTMKDKDLVKFDGLVPGFNAVNKLGEAANTYS